MSTGWTDISAVQAETHVENHCKVRKLLLHVLVHPACCTLTTTDYNERRTTAAHRCTPFIHEVNCFQHHRNKLQLKIGVLYRVHIYFFDKLQQYFFGRPYCSEWYRSVANSVLFNEVLFTQLLVPAAKQKRSRGSDLCAV